MTYYKIIGGVRYDRRLLEAADTFIQGRGEFRISLEEMQNLYQQATDGKVITELEKGTLRYIASHYPLTEKAKTWFSEQFETPEDALQSTLQKVLRTDYGLLNLRCEISTATIQQYLDTGTRAWKDVLKGAIEAFLHLSQGTLSFSACVARRDGMFGLVSDPTDLLKTYLDRGTLYLIPPDATQQSALPYDLPHHLDIEYFWTFVLQIPDFEPVEFFAFVHLQQPFQYSRGQFSKKAGLEQIINAAVQFTQFNRLKWNIPAEEVLRQMAILPNQNFGNALFSVLNAGIFNQESSASFGDFIRDEIWPDPDIEISEQMRAYANTGTLHLIPLNYRALTDSGNAAFPIPPQYAFWTDGEWVFGLEMPRKTQIKLIITTPRDGNDGDTAWNDCFIEDTLPLEMRLQAIITDEFKLNGLQLNVDHAEFEAQRQQYGPDWRQLPGLLRQSLNTLLNDYVSVNSMFNVVAKAQETDIDPTYFDDPKEYRAAVRHSIENYLRTGAVLSLLPYTIAEENVFPKGETVAENWLARAVAETLADHYFWIVMPRWPDDEQRPTNYID